MVTTETEDDPFKGWNILLKEYEEETEDDLTDLQEELVNLKMGKTEKPTNFLNKLKLINERLAKIDSKYKMDAPQLKSQLMSKLPTEYKTIKTVLKVAKLSSVPLTDIIKELDAYYEDNGLGPKDGKNDNRTHVGMGKKIWT